MFCGDFFFREKDKARDMLGKALRRWAFNHHDALDTLMQAFDAPGDGAAAG